MKYQPIKVPDLGQPGREFRFHADCIRAARESYYKGICRTCYDDAASCMPRPSNITRGMQTVMNFISVYKPDGTIDLDECLDDGGRFDPQ